MTEQTIYKNIERGKALKAMRKTMRQRQRNIASMLGVEQGNYSKMESGVLRISDERLLKVKKCFDVFRVSEINRLRNSIKELEQFELLHTSVQNLEVCDATGDDSSKTA